MLNIVCLCLILLYWIAYCSSSCSGIFNHQVEINGECYNCPKGLYGVNCTNTCPSNHYGYECREKCNCFSNFFCHAIFGCVLLDRKIRYVLGNDDKIWSMDIVTWYTISLVSLGFAVVMSVVSCISCALRNSKDLSAYHPKHLVDMLSLMVTDRLQTDNIRSDIVMDTPNAGNNIAATENLQIYSEINESYPPPTNRAPAPPPAANKPTANVEIEVEYLEPGPSRKNFPFKSTESEEDAEAFNFYNSLTLRSNSSNVMSGFGEYAEVRKYSVKGKGKGKGKSKINPIKRISQLVTDAYHSRGSDKHYDFRYRKDSKSNNVY